jgi:outer membrane protein OmpA-like peptidoglycan-associated protein
MKWILAFFCTALFLLTHGQKMIVSFYFPRDNSIPTDYSKEKLQHFKKTVIEDSITILEINSFTDSTGTTDSNEKLALQRLDYIKNFLPKTDSTQFNAYGLKRPYEVVNVVNWRRVDIVYIYNKSGKQKEDLKETKLTKGGANEEKITSENEIIELSVINMYEESLNSMKPLILDISFKEGTSRLLEFSYYEVQRLANYLKENPNVNAEIRGHVCCGNNLRISKSRAKAVYKRLLRLGIVEIRLNYIGMSNREPLVYPERTDADRQTNRRVDVKLSIK